MREVLETDEVSLKLDGILLRIDPIIDGTYWPWLPPLDEDAFQLVTDPPRLLDLLILNCSEISGASTDLRVMLVSAASAAGGSLDSSLLTDSWAFELMADGRLM